MVRLSRRGSLSIEAFDGHFDVRFQAPGPALGRGWCTLDEADLWEHCHFGAASWRGDGLDLDALVVECEEATRPRRADVEDLRHKIEYRRNSRTHGPPLPDYMRWNGWRPGGGRWLRTSAHQHEYLGGYLRDLSEERKFDREQAMAELRRQMPRIPRRDTSLGDVES